MRHHLILLLLLIVGTPLHAAGPAPFDLAGPSLNIVVTRGSMMLPASEVPHLAVGDRIWIRPEFPDSQSAHYLMVATFLAGPTNPPPESWFFECKTWTGRCAREGLTVTVPPGAQQALVFLAPETKGDLKGIVNAVLGQPGAFVRATQDLNQAQLDRSRLERYLAAIHRLERGDPAELKNAAPLLARSLAIKVKEECLDRIRQLQAACLTENQDALILNDAHSMSIAQALTSGPVADLVKAVSSTPELGYGVYSPYIGSVIDIVRIFDSFTTAQYQYIPALSSFRGDKVALTLNAAPSFHNPKSVMVMALPAIEAPQLPPLRAVNPAEIHCASRNELVLPVEGAPLAFSTHFAHDIALTLSNEQGQTLRLPAVADAERGGYVVNTAGLRSARLGDTLNGTLQGYWGFELYRGPGFQLRNARAGHWALARGSDEALVAGRPDTIHLQADSVSCVDDIMLRDGAGKALDVQWRMLKPGEVEVTLPLQHAEPGSMTVVVSQSGLSEPHTIPIRVFGSAARLDRFSIHAGDATGVLRGSRLDQVARLQLNGLEFEPAELSTEGGNDVLTLIARDADAASTLRRGDTVQASATLSDGRTLNVQARVEAPRPRVRLIGRNITRSPTGEASHIELTGEDALPQDARIVFSLRAESPGSFARDEVIEVAAADESFGTTLSIAGGGVRLENRSVALATLDPSKAFGFSAFGPLKFRARIGEVAGDWQPLATLVRLPQLDALHCHEERDRACWLDGADLFLVDAISDNSGFDPAVKVSDGFPGTRLPVPQPRDGRLYLRLRDHPEAISTVSLPPRIIPSPKPARAEPPPAAVSQDAGSAVEPAPSGTPADEPPPSTPPLPAAPTEEAPPPADGPPP